MSFFYPKPKYELYSVKTTTLQKIENTFTLYFFSTHIFLEKIPKKYRFLQKIPICGAFRVQPNMAIINGF